MKRTRALFLSLGCLGILWSTFSCGGQQGAVVSTDSVAVRTIIETVSASGKIQPEVELKISSNVSGQIVELYIQEGDSVKKGDLLLIINPDIYQSEFERMQAMVKQSLANLSNAKAREAQAEAQLFQAEENYKRNKILFDKKAISQAEYDQIYTQFKVAQSELKAAKESVLASEYTVQSNQAALKSASDNLTRTRIYAPMDGIISKLDVEKGENVVGTGQMQGTEMLRIANLNVMEVNVEVNENDIVKVDLGDTAEIQVDAYLNRKFKGIVTSIANSAKTSVASVATDEVTNFEVKIRILRESYEDLLTDGKASPFRPGMSATVDVQTQIAKDVLTVPIQAVTTRDDSTGQAGTSSLKEMIFVLKGDTVQLLPVKTGIQDNRFIQITDGVKLGEVIVEGPYNMISKELKSGDKVTVSNKNDIFAPKK